MSYSNLILENKWNGLSENDKKFVVEFLIIANPDKKIPLKESRWWNTLGDVVGIFDPTGIVDLINGLDYIRQGDYFFGFLSLVAAVPIVGDIFAKPVIGAMKIGKGSTAALKGALEAAKLGKDAEALRTISTLGKTEGVVGKFVRGAGRWGDKLISIIEKLPGGRISKGLKNTLIEWIQLFQQGSKAGRNIARGSRRLASSWRALSQTEKVANIEKLIVATKGTGLFKGYKAVNPSLWSKYVRGGMPRLWGNRSTRALMRKTKWYAGLLDWMGIGNFVGPDELTAKFGEEETAKLVDQYNQTPEANEYWMDEFGNVQSKTPETMEPMDTNIGTKKGDPSSEPFMNAFKIFFG
jgi:hypothetical protein